MSTPSSPAFAAEPARPRPGEPARVLIAPGASRRGYARELWRYRELMLMLAWRDLAVRYKQTALGLVWAWARPLVTTLVLTFAFSRVAGLKSEAPYLLVALTGVWPWFLFAGLLGDVSSSLVGNANLVAKVYFPRLVLPLSAAAVAIVDFGVQGALVALALAAFGWRPGPLALLAPLFALWVAAAALGPALALAALNVRYRDVRYLTPLIVQFGLYISPVGFAGDAVPPAWAFLLALNPVAGGIDGLRWCLIGGACPILREAPGLAIAAAGLMFGYWRFRAAERDFADLI